jgi:hypothetical protein
MHERQVGGNLGQIPLSWIIGAEARQFACQDEGEQKRQGQDVQRVDAGEARDEIGAQLRAGRESVAVGQRDDEPAQDEEEIDHDVEAFRRRAPTPQTQFEIQIVMVDDDTAGGEKPKGVERDQPHLARRRPSRARQIALHGEPRGRLKRRGLCGRARSWLRIA